MSYLILKTARSYLHLSGRNTGTWRTDGRTDGQTDRQTVLPWLLQQSALRAMRTHCNEMLCYVLWFFFAHSEDHQGLKRDGRAGVSNKTQWYSRKLTMWCIPWETWSKNNITARWLLFSTLLLVLFMLILIFLVLFLHWSMLSSKWSYPTNIVKQQNWNRTSVCKLKGLDANSARKVYFWKMISVTVTSKHITLKMSSGSCGPGNE